MEVVVNDLTITAYIHSTANANVVHRINGGTGDTRFGTNCHLTPIPRHYNGPLVESYLITKLMTINYLSRTNKLYLTVRERIDDGEPIEFHPSVQFYLGQPKFKVKAYRPYYHSLNSSRYLFATLISE